MKYFKFANLDDTTFCDGIVQTLDLSDDHESGGVEFYSRDTFLFHSDGTEVYEVSPLDDVYENSIAPKKYRCNVVKLKRIGSSRELSTIKYLVENGVSLHNVCVTDVGSASIEGGPFILGIVAFGLTGILEYFVDLGVSILPTDSRLLELASTTGECEMVKYLLSSGVHLHGNRDRALQCACEWGWLDTVKYIVSRENGSYTWDGDFVECAAENGRTDIVRYLCEIGFSIRRNKDEAFRAACANGHLDTVKYLVENGADIHANGDFALTWVSLRDHVGVLKYLVSQGLDVHIANDRALRLSSIYRCVGVNEYLQTLYTCDDYRRIFIDATEEK